LLRPALLEVRLSDQHRHMAAGTLDALHIVNSAGGVPRRKCRHHGRFELRTSAPLPLSKAWRSLVAHRSGASL